MRTTFIRVCLVVACTMIILVPVSVKGEEVLILDDSATSHVVSVLYVSSGRAVRKPLAEDVSWFDISRTGHFLMRDVTKKWFTGNVDSSLTVKRRTLRSVPGNITHAAISHDGTRIAWATTDSVKSGLLVEQYSKDDPPRVLHNISKDGIIAVPSWSPDGKKVAFYYGLPDAIWKDGFSLMLLDLTAEAAQLRTIAPPSLWTRLSPARPIPPSWAPDGKNILFEARYRDEEPPGGAYVVSIDGKRLVSSPFGTWDEDGKRVRTFGRETRDSGTFVVSEEDVLQERNTHTQHHLKLTGNPSVVSISPSGGKIAYIRDRKIFLHDTTTGHATSYGTSDYTAKVA